MEYLSKITPVGSDVTYFLLTNVTEDPVEIGISLTDGKSAWKGQGNYVFMNLVLSYL